MSVERAREFINAVVSDPALRAELMRAKAEGNPEVGRAAVQKAGYGDITAEDVDAALAPGPNGELSQAQLDGVTGGFGLLDILSAAKDGLKRYYSSVTTTTYEVPKQ
jgi:predicted ribosomally synthesized peptide with nif11-like leader